MGLRDELQAELAAAFDEDLADAVNVFDGKYIIKGDDWDPVTESSTDTVIGYSGRGVLSRYATSKIDNVNILMGDLKLTALTNEVTGIPQVNHTITTKDLVTHELRAYSVKSVGTDPAGATYSIQLRGG
ncbi:TPA: glutamate 5-kinase [Providencia rettgeri]|uniref:glutamate 5-kinase n=1 Tax=Providencia rettgeri TaxID=587 RepID=UPI00235E4771|nr:glutamate 5-kinase [Providencia rettgeri]